MSDHTDDQVARLRARLAALKDTPAQRPAPKRLHGLVSATKATRSTHLRLLGNVLDSKAHDFNVHMRRIVKSGEVAHDDSDWLEMLHLQTGMFKALSQLSVAQMDEATTALEAALERVEELETELGIRSKAETSRYRRGSALIAKGAVHVFSVNENGALARVTDGGKTLDVSTSKDAGCSCSEPWPCEHEAAVRLVTTTEQAKAAPSGAAPMAFAAAGAVRIRMLGIESGLVDVVDQRKTFTVRRSGFGWDCNCGVANGECVHAKATIALTRSST